MGSRIETAARINRLALAKEAAYRVERFEHARCFVVQQLFVDAVVKIADDRTVEIAQELFAIRIPASVAVFRHGLPLLDKRGGQARVSGAKEFDILAGRQIQAIAPIDDGTNDIGDHALDPGCFGFGPFTRASRIPFPEIDARPQPVVIAVALNEIEVSG